MSSPARAPTRQAWADAVHAATEAPRVPELSAARTVVALRPLTADRHRGPGRGDALNPEHGAQAVRGRRSGSRTRKAAPACDGPEPAGAPDPRRAALAVRVWRSPALEAADHRQRRLPRGVTPSSSPPTAAWRAAPHHPGARRDRGNGG